MGLVIRPYVEFTLPERLCLQLKDLVQNEIYEDEKPQEAAFREMIFTRIGMGRLTPAGRMKEAMITFSITDECARWLKSLLSKPLYDDESKEEGEFRAGINNEFWCPDVGPIIAAREFWDDIPF
jgi:hypothetical protein